MNDNPPLQDVSNRSCRRLWVILALLIVLPLIAIAGVLTFRQCSFLWKHPEVEAEANRQLGEAIAEPSRLDPHWRLEDIEADRAVVRDERNSALVAMEAARLKPKRWPFWEFGVEHEDGDLVSRIHPLDDSFSDLELHRQLSPEMITALRTELERAAAALDQSRKLADLPEGRYPITYPDDWFATPVPHLSGTRQIAHLLAYDVMLRAQDADTDAALNSCLAILNAARSFGDEPFLSSSLVRTGCDAIAVGKTQRVLAQGQPTVAALERLQQLFEKEEAEPVSLIGLRGERAGGDRLLSEVQAGKRQLSHSGRGGLCDSA